MRKTSFVLSFVIVVGVIFSGCSSNKNTSSTNSKSQLTSQIENLEKENKTLKKNLKDVTDELNAMKTNSQKQTWKYSPEVDAMLNIEDASVFNDNFRHFETSMIHPRSREMYQWVSKIHELDSLLVIIEKDHKSIEELNANITNLPPTTIKELGSINSSIKENIKNARNIRNVVNQSIDEMRMSFTSSQMNYYNSLKDKLSDYINIYFE